MPGNTDPIYSRVGSLSRDNVASPNSGMNQPILLASGDFTGAGANNSLVWTADPTNGGFVQRLRFKASGTNVATVARIYINNGGVSTNAANNLFHGEVSLPATTLINTAATPEPEYTLNFAFDPGFRLYVGLGTAVAAGWTVSVISGKY